MNKAMELLRGLVSEIERQTCEHEETHRGGAIWEICDSCGAKWADDEGGKPEFEWPESVEKAREFLAAHPTVEQAGGDERAAFFKHLIGRHPAHETEIVRVVEHNYAAWKAWRARAALAQPSLMPPDRGPWHAVKWDGGRRVDLSSDDFEHDVALTVSGDFVEGDKFRYAQELAAWMNAHLAQPSPARAEKAEAERPELWAVHAQGPDELYAAFTREGAEKHAAELNALPMPEGIAVGAVVVPSPWPEVEHWKYLAEQERDHKNEIAVRLRQFERICEWLPQDAIDGGWTVQGIRCYAKRLEDQLKSALARVAEVETMVRMLEEREWAEHVGESELGQRLEAAITTLINEASEFGDMPKDWRVVAKSNCFVLMEGNSVIASLAGPQSELNAARIAGALSKAPPAQAQHSVPEEFSFEYRHPNGECHTVTVSREQVINEMPDFLFEALCSKFCNCEPVGETNVVECCCDEYAEEFKLIAAAPGKGVGHE
ncbi:TPA: hypothetical protein ACU6E5_004292 [Pseudomonas aeruginosa]